jgi:hypothetical protein
VSAAAKGQSTKDTDGIVGDACGQVRRFCWVRLDEVPRLDALARRLRSLHGENTARVQRPDLLAVLLLSGLDLAEAKATTLVIFPGIGARYEYRLKLDDVERVKRLVRTCWPAPTGRPSQGYAHGALIRLALQAAETDKTFESTLASRLLAALEAACAAR